MMTRTKTLTAATGIALGALALTGCSMIEDAVGNQVENAIEEGAEQATGVDIEVGDDVGVPNGFPSELPLPEGPIAAAFGTDEGWQLTYELADMTAVEALVDDLSGLSGFEQQETVDLGGVMGWTFTSAEYSVTLTVVESDESVQLGYLVVRADQA